MNYQSSLKRKQTTRTAYLCSVTDRDYVDTLTEKTSGPDSATGELYQCLGKNWYQI